MGIYIFNRDVLLKLLDNALTDFGKHILPSMVKSHKLVAYDFDTNQLGLFGISAGGFFASWAVVETASKPM